jgi:hypothetical protein
MKFLNDYDKRGGLVAPSGVAKFTHDMIPLLCAGIHISSNRLVGCDDHIYRDIACTDGYLSRGQHLFSQSQSDWEKRRNGKLESKGPSSYEAQTHRRGASGGRGQRRASNTKRGNGHSSPCRVRGVITIDRMRRLVVEVRGSRKEEDAIRGGGKIDRALEVRTGVILNERGGALPGIKMTSSGSLSSSVAVVGPPPVSERDG